MHKAIYYEFPSRTAVHHMGVNDRKDIWHDTLSSLEPKHNGKYG